MDPITITITEADLLAATAPVYRYTGDDDEGYSEVVGAPPSLGEAVIRAAANVIAHDKRVSERAERAVAKLLAARAQVEIDRQIGPIVTEALTRPFPTVNSYGEPQRAETTMRELIMAEVLQSLSFEHRLVGGHVHVKVRAGQAGSRGLCGDLTMRPDEWDLLRQVLERGRADASGVTPEDPDVVFNPDGWTPGGTSRALQQFDDLREAVLELLRWEHDHDVLPAELYIGLAVAVDHEPDRARAVAAEWKARTDAVDAEFASTHPRLPGVES